MHVGSIQFRMLGLLAIGTICSMIACSGGGGGGSSSTPPANQQIISTIESVTITPGSLTLNTGAQGQFSATVSGTTGYNPAVTWSALLGTISGTGLYTAPASGGSDVVTAKSVQTPTISASVNVTVEVPTTITAVAVDPPSTTVNAGAQAQFAATVTGTGPTAVTWSAKLGTITSSGLYTAPAAGGSDVVTAASVADPAVSAAATISVVVPAAIGSVQVNPSALTLNAGAQTQFTAPVTGTGAFSANVTWSASLGTITSTGLYTAPAAAGTDTVTATSVETPADKATATVTVVVPTTVSSVTVSPSTVQLNADATNQFTATLAGSGSFSQAVTWSAQRGTITSTGLYTAPASGGSDTVTATSVQTPTDTGTASITVVVPAVVTSVAVTPATLALNIGAQQTFAATVAGTGSFSQAVTWSAQRGTITSAGVYTAPATGGSDVVTAASAQTPSMTATANLTVVVPIVITSVAVSPTTISVNSGSQNTFSATVLGTGAFSSAVTWSAQRGSISGAGVYTAPATGGSDVVTAKSVQTPTMTAAANVTVVVPATISSVTVSPATLALNINAQGSFSATVTGTGAFSSGVTWSAQRGTITGAGVYTAPATGGSDVITAASTETPSMTATANVTVVVPPVVTAVAVSPATLTLTSGTQNQFSVTVTGTGSYSSGVTWSAQRGTITGAGLYTAPATSGTDVVTVTSTQDATKAASANLTISATGSTGPVTAAPITAPAEVQANSGPYTASVTLGSGLTAQWAITGGTLLSSTGASVTFQAGAGPTGTLTCTVSNGTNSATSQRWFVPLPFAPRNYAADLKGYLNTYGASITADIAGNNVGSYYQDSYYLLGMAAYEEVSGDTQMMAKSVAYLNQILALAQPLVRNGITYQELPPWDVNGNPQQSPTFQISEAMVRTAVVIYSRPEFASYKSTADAVIAFVDQSIFKYWFDKNTGVYADPSSTYLAGNIPWVSAALGGWGSYDYMCQQAFHFAMVSTWMYQATQNPLYLDAATRMAETFQTIDLQTLGTAPNTYYLWDLGKYTFETPDNLDGSQDTSHANRVPMLMQAWYENGIVFTLADLKLLAAGFTTVIWNQSETSPMFSNYIDGSNLGYRTITTPGENGLVYHGWDTLGRCSPEAHRVFALTYNDMCTNPNLNASVNANYSSYGLIEMSGILYRNTLEY